jgi:hypothetical protein
MGFRGVKPLADALTDGWNYDSFFTKTSSPIPLLSDHWADWSMGAGVPKYNAYVGVQYESTQLFGAGNFGLYSGGNIAPKAKHISSISFGTQFGINHGYFELCDYLLFYPLIDCDSTDVQEFDNIATLPRYTSGEGVKLMIVCTTPQTTGGVVMTINYTNSNGVAKTTTRFLDAVNVGCIQGKGAASGAHCSPFVHLAAGDIGIRSVESVQLNTGAGGFVALVLVRPLVPATLREANTFTEIDYLFMHPTLRQVYDGAYLNFIQKTSATSSIGMRGHVTFTGV